jgi:hypothetical protein
LGERFVGCVLAVHRREGQRRGPRRMIH